MIPETIITISIFGTAFICIASVLIKKSGKHADEKHKDVAKLVRDSYHKNGLFESWKEPNGTYHLICEVSDSVYGDYVIVLGHKNILFEKSAFIPKMGDLENIHKWLKAKNAKQVFNFEKEIENGHNQ